MKIKFERAKFENIFRSAEFKLTMLYFLIILGILLVFNIVIFAVMSTDRLAISNDFAESLITENFQKTIIEARNSQADQKMTESLAVLDAFIIVIGGLGSLVLARKTLAPLEKAHQLQSEFVSNASHEIRTPLSTIQLETELILKDKNASKEDLREVLSSNLEEAKSLTALTQMLLRLSKIEKLKLERVNLNEVIRNRIERLGSDKISLEESKTFTVHANETAVDELITILLDNALRYNNSKEKIAVKIFRSYGQAVFEVSNAREEMSKEQLDRMFERFYRVDCARSCNSKADGHGLGLAIAQKLVENLEGSLSVRNEKFITEQNPEGEFRITFRVGLNFEK
ncbi:MAG: ATP-binding protein [bacterium]|nr:ATP-binding protein [bacterium]